MQQSEMERVLDNAARMSTINISTTPVVLTDDGFVSPEQAEADKQEKPIEEMQFASKDELSYEIITLYVKKGCKKCLGRGYQIWDNTSKAWASYCPCVTKGIRRAAEKELEARRKAAKS